MLHAAEDKAARGDAQSQGLDVSLCAWGLRASGKYVVLNNVFPYDLNRLIQDFPYLN